ncbi:BZ3500_MvSof-1268-A1-R1_Chr7-1g09444 [Microbotryum saponariae]|uniref:BZ3500_MvSof-1268-A1-R1_Chr7-1g09444 protein n=1 Tax=Microbotryum saponariae TaxID=289078 RepID=A0A2X0LEG5_9BASI|nr:BZ3501_MvSof-1269-A2-R1_Chr7-1g09149 [Microbotryum saponariae]SDA03460.1 BZ3500_MvSof-1268-A1-R1_Chr7-1g09444 [Microbotryum saponariae]
MEENGSRVSDEVGDEDELEQLVEPKMQRTAYEPSRPTRARWYGRVGRKGMGHGVFDAPTKGAQVAFATLALGLMLALAVQTARLSSATANKPAERSQLFDSSGLPGPIEDVNPASMVVRIPPAPFNESSIVAGRPSDPHGPVWRLSDDASRLPNCGQLILMPLSAAGWGANVGLLLRGTMSYGRLEYYFEPYTIDCVPPSDWYDESQTTRLRAKGWRKAAHIRVSRKDTRHMDAMDQELFFDREKDGLQHAQRLMLGRNPKPSVLRLLRLFEHR